MLAWHFVNDTLRDGRPIPADGEKLTHDGDLIMCAAGLHASSRIVDALKYAPGHTVCRVKLTGTIKCDDDKCVASERTILWRFDAEEHLRHFARTCALDVIHLWNAPDCVVAYLKTGDDGLRAAAYAAAGATARDAAGAAAGAAVWDAAGVAAGAAARDAARAAAWAAAWDAAWDAARDAARGATRGAAVHDLIGQHGFTQEHYDLLVGPWESVMGPIQYGPVRSDTIRYDPIRSDTIRYEPPAI